MKVLFNSLYYIFVTLIIAVALMLLMSTVPVPGNIKVKIVQSGSMEPTIMTGGIIVIRPASLYEVGDIITFGKDTKTQIPTTHRIVKKEGSGLNAVFTTKGDANDAEDPKPTNYSEIGGKVLFTLPYLGYILSFAKKPMGFVLLVGVPALIIILDEIQKIIGEVRKIKRKKTTNEETE